MRRLLLPILILAAVASACSFTVGSKTPSDDHVARHRR